MSGEHRPIDETPERCVHELKSLPMFFQALASGVKTFEIRTNDRDFNPGDELRICEWNPKTQAYTGRALSRHVTYVSSYMQQDDYVVLGLTAQTPAVPFQGGDPDAAPAGLPAMSTAYVEMQMSLGLARITFRELRGRVSVLEHNKEVLEADRDHWRNESSRISVEGLERHENWKAAERKLEELRSNLHQFATPGPTREAARAWLLAEAKAYNTRLQAERAPTVRPPRCRLAEFCFQDAGHDGECDDIPF